MRNMSSAERPCGSPVDALVGAVGLGENGQESGSPVIGIANIRNAVCLVPDTIRMDPPKS